MEVMIQEFPMRVPLPDAEDGLEYEAVKGAGSIGSISDTSVTFRLLAVSFLVLRKATPVAIAEGREIEATLKFGVFIEPDLAVQVARMLFLQYKRILPAKVKRASAP
jgi:hypothetical protein